MFTQIPSNLSSLYSELTYSYTTTSTGDITLQIFEDETDELIGVKKFISTNSAQVNIAPHIRAYAMPSIESQPMGFISTYRNSNVSVYLKRAEDGATSTARQYSISRSDLQMNGLLSSMPNARCISDGESEQIHLCVSEGNPVTITIKKYLTEWDSSYYRPYLDGDFEEQIASSESYSTTPNDGSLVIFNFVAEAERAQNSTQVERIVLTATQNSSVIAELTYRVIDSPQEGVRVAWLCESGAIEHYTFPVIKEEHFESEYRKIVTLSSAYEAYATRAAISKIIQSPRVWICQGGEYIEASAEDINISVSSLNSLGSVDLKLSYLA